MIVVEDMLDGMPGSPARKVKFSINPEIGIHGNLTSDDVIEAVHISNKNPDFWKVLSRADEMQGGVVEITAATGRQADEIDSILGYLAARPAAISKEDQQTLTERQAASSTIRAQQLGQIIVEAVNHWDNLSPELRPGFEELFSIGLSRPYPVVEA